MKTPDWVAGYVGIPFKVCGRTREGCDCWGLVRLVLAEQYGVDVPAFDDGYTDFKNLRRMARIVESGKPLVDAARIDGPQPGAVVVMNVNGHPCHVGITPDGRHVLHVEHGANSVYQRLDDAQIKMRVEGFYLVG